MRRLFNLWPARRRRMERELEREMRDHLDRRMADLRRANPRLTEHEARRIAAVEFGGVAQVREDVRDTWGSRWIDNRLRDLRYAIRTLTRSPIFTATALISLALGIGANAALFSLIDQALLRPLDVREPERLVHLRWNGASLTSQYSYGNLMSYPLCRDFDERREVFDGAFCRHSRNVIFSSGQPGELPRPVRVEIVSGSYFPVLGVRPEAGRLIGRSDDRQAAAHPVVVISYRHWQREFGGRTDVIGRSVLLNNHPMTVIGIAPASFTGVDPLTPPALWIPATMTVPAAPVDSDRDLTVDRRAAWMHVLARLKPGVTAEAARARLQPWFSAMLDEDTRREQFPNVSAEDRRGFLRSTVDLLPGAHGVSAARGGIERPLLVVMGGTLLLLLLASLNVAGLFLARGAARMRELTTRMALGASRARIVAQLLVESSVITVAGGLLGLAVAPLVAQALLVFVSRDGNLVYRLDARVVWFTLAASLVTGAICGVAPALQTGRVPLIAALTDRSRIAGARGVRLRKTLIVAQLALTLLLLMAAVLFVRTVTHLRDRVGFASSQLLMFGVDPTSVGYDEARAEQVMRDLSARLQQLPGVERVAVANIELLSGGLAGGRMTISFAESGERLVTDRAALVMRSGPGFFSTIGAQVIAGRDFDARDVRAPGAKPMPWRTAIVSENFVRRYFNGRNPLGARIGRGALPDTVADIEIIGVVKDFSRSTLRDDRPGLVILPFWDRQSATGVFYVKTRGTPESVFASIRAAVAELAPGHPSIEVKSYDTQVQQSLRPERMLAALSSGFGVLALLLSVVGLYGVMAFVVTQRRQEIGLRLALGATRGAAVWLVVRDALTMTLLGIATALPLAWMLRRLIEAQLYGVRAFDVPAIAAASVVLALVALAGAVIPAWRAASVSPTEALRLE